MTLVTGSHYLLHHLQHSCSVQSLSPSQSLSLFFLSCYHVMQYCVAVEQQDTVDGCERKITATDQDQASLCVSLSLVDSSYEMFSPRRV